MLKQFAAAGAAIMLGLVGSAQAAVIHGLDGGTSAPIDSVAYQLTQGPKTTIGGAITWTATVDSLFGFGGDSWYFSHNGEWVQPTFAALNGSEGAMTFAFATPVAAFLADMNWAPDENFAVTLEAYDTAGTLLEILELSNGSTNSTTPGYLGFSRDSADIASFVVRNGFVGVRDITYSLAPVVGGAVPEPATWAMMIIGFGATGALLRRSRLQPQRQTQA